jgi:hypothetical protein
VEERYASYWEDRNRVSDDLAQLEAHLSRILELLSDAGDEQMSPAIEETRDIEQRLAAARVRILKATQQLPNLIAGKDGEPGPTEIETANRLVLDATASLSTAEADVVALEATLEAAEPERGSVELAAAFPQSSGPFGWIKRQFRAIKAIFSRLAKRLVAMLANLLTPKEWTIGGEISGGVPALALGKVTIDITFGP